MVITFSWYFMVLNRFSSWQLNYHRFMFPAHTHLLNFRYIYFWSHEYISLEEAWWIENLWVLNMRKIASKPQNILKIAFKMILQYCTEFIWGHCAAKLLWKYETIDFVSYVGFFFCSSHVIVISQFFYSIKAQKSSIESAKLEFKYLYLWWSCNWLS